LAQSPIPNPQSPIPNPQYPSSIVKLKITFKIKLNKSHKSRNLFIILLEKYKV